MTQTPITQDMLRAVAEPLGYKHSTTGGNSEAFCKRFRERLSHSQFELYNVKLAISSEDFTVFVMLERQDEEAQRSFDSLDDVRQFLTGLEAYVSNWGAVSQYEGWTVTSALDQLSDEYTVWLAAQGIEAGCAEELLHDADHGVHGKALSAEQRAWVVSFIQRWDHCALLSKFSRIRLVEGSAMNADGDPVDAYCILTDGTDIYDPYSSECGRFEVDPVKAYGITAEEAEALVKLNCALGVSMFSSKGCGL